MNVKRVMVGVYLLVMVVVAAIPASAAPRWLSAVPRAVGRSYGNMFTFRRPWVAAQQWMTLGALVFDETTTQQAFNRCRGCVESSPMAFYYHGRTGTKGAILDTVMTGTLETAYINYVAEYTHDVPGRGWHNAYTAIPITFITMHAVAGHSNMGH